MKFTCIFFTYLLFLSSWAQDTTTLYPKQIKLIKQTISKQFDGVAEKVFLGKTLITTCIVGQDTFFNPDGYYYLFKLKGDSAIRLDLSQYHGANFGRHLFSWNNKIYQLGGYGYFTNHSNLIFFENISREWLFQPTKGQAPGFMNGKTFLYNNSIYSFSHLKGGNYAEEDIIDSSLYQLDLLKMTWKKYVNFDKRLIMEGDYFETNDFFWCHNQVYSAIIKKKQLKYIIIDNEKVGCVACKKIKYQINNNLFFSWPSSSLIDEGYCKINLDSLWSTYRESQESLIPQTKEVTVETQQSRATWYFLVILSAFALGIFLWFKKVKKNAQIITNQIVNEEDEVQNTNTEIMYRKIIELNKEILSMEELDIALEINHLTLESRKLRRHRHLTELNKMYPGFIVRTKDEVDKRKFLYRISKKA
jgi:hypothetical protein